MSELLGILRRNRCRWRLWRMNRELAGEERCYLNEILPYARSVEGARYMREDHEQVMDHIRKRWLE